MAVWQLCPSCWTKKRMNIPSSAYPAIGAVMAAIIAAGISFLVTVLAKEQKTSEFRQAWIDALRKDLSEFIATVDMLSSFHRLKMSRGHRPEDLVGFLEERSDDVRRMGVSYHRIMLRLNPQEHATIIGKLEKLLSIMSSYQKVLDETGVNELIKGVIAEGQVVLKSEWRRVKRGELTFVITKYVSLTLFVLAVCFAVLVGRGYLVITIHG